MERVQKRRKTEYSVPAVPMIEGAVFQVRIWSYGSLSKRDASRFSRAVKFLPVFLRSMCLMLSCTSFTNHFGLSWSMSCP